MTALRVSQASAREADLVRQQSAVADVEADAAEVWLLLWRLNTECCTLTQELCITGV